MRASRTDANRGAIDPPGANRAPAAIRNDAAGVAAAMNRRVNRRRLGERASHPARRQAGWAGLVLLLIALVVAGWLARVALRQLAPADTASGAPARVDNPTAPTPAGAVQRAKSVEADVLKHAQDLQQRIDASEK